MPAHAGVEQVHASGFQLAGQVKHFLPVAAVLDQVHQGQAKADDEVLGHGRAYALHDAQRKAAAAGGIAAPFVGAEVGQRRQKLVDQIALAAHDLHTVIAGFPGQSGAAHIVGNDLLDLRCAEFTRAAAAELGEHAAGRDAAAAVVVAAHMQYLHEDMAALGMHRIGDEAVPGRLLWRAQCRELGMLGHSQCVLVDAEAPCDDELQPFPCTFGVEEGQLFKTLRLILQPGMHGAHQNPVLQGDMADGDGLEEMGIHG